MDFKKILEKYNKAVKYSAFALFIIAAGVFYVMSGRKSDREKDTFADIAVESTKEYMEYDSSTHSQDIYVYVCGYVNSPGVVRCEEQMRIYEAVELAGGVSEEADLSSVNLAAQLKDGDRVYIPCIGETVVAQMESSENARLININKATESELMTLPGIGSSRAADIISYRNTNGRFTRTEDIMKVSGIKEAAYNKIKDYICV